MVDVETHKIIDMIESSEMEDVKRWLEEYPNIRMVSRDGSHTYAAAITAAHPRVARPVSSVKNLTDYATIALQKLFRAE